MIITGNNKDKFGYYQVGDFKTYSKVEAIELHGITGIHPHWNFNEDFFKNYNWAVEPTESLDELYARRASQIRNDYDYIVLFYSGGADSNNILETFVKNNIKIDEVATYNFQSIDSDPDSHFNGELTKVAWPKLKSLKDQGYNFIHRNIDLSEISAEILTDKNYLITRAYYASVHWGTAHVARSYMRERIPEYKKIIESGKKLVFVWGSDKPRLYKENGKYCMKFLDLIDSAINFRTQMRNKEEEYDELFYWAPEAVDIISKQCHVLKRFFDKLDIININNIDFSDPFAFNDPNLTAFYRYNLEYRAPDLQTTFANNKTVDGMSYRNLINSIIYSNFIPGTFSVGKSGNLILSNREVKFHKDREFIKHTHMLLEHLRSLDTYWLADPNNLFKGLKLCTSPSYYLE